MHTIYKTEGLILKSINIAEANRMFWILTSDLGLIRATAQGVRLLKSKLRYALTDFSLVNFSLVRGRDIWRITSAEKLIALPIGSVNEQKEIKLISRLFSLVLRLIQGEDKNEKIFVDLKQAIEFLFQHNLTDEQLKNFECILALRLLSDLGYLSSVGDFEVFIKTPYFDLDLISSLGVLQAKAVGEINRSLKESQL